MILKLVYCISNNVWIDYVIYYYSHGTSISSPSHPMGSRSRNKHRNLWDGWCLSWGPWSWSVYSIYYTCNIHTVYYICILSNWNRLFLRDLNFIVQDYLYHDMYIGRIWHCALVSWTPSQAIGLIFGSALYWCWVSIRVPLLIALYKVIFHHDGFYCDWNFMAILIILIWILGFR